MKQTARRQSALNNVAQKRAMVVNLDALVRVYLLDGSSKLLQMFEDSSVADVLIALKSNMDLEDVSTYGLFRVIGTSVRRLELKERVSYALKDPTDSGQEVRLLFRSWISYRYGVFDRCVFQEGVRDKQPNTELWLAYMEGTFMCMSGKYYLSEDESVLLGCLRMQVGFLFSFTVWEI